MRDTERPTPQLSTLGPTAPVPPETEDRARRFISRAVDEHRLTPGDADQVREALAL